MVARIYLGALHKNLKEYPAMLPPNIKFLCKAPKYLRLISSLAVTVLLIITLTILPIASAWIAGKGTGGGDVALKVSYIFSDSGDKQITINYNPPAYGYPFNHSVTWLWDGKALVAMHVYRLYITKYIGVTPVTLETKLSADIVGVAGGPYYYSLGSGDYLWEYYIYYYVKFNNKDASALSARYTKSSTKTFCVESSTIEEAQATIEAGLSAIFEVVYSISFGGATQSGETICIDTTWSTDIYEYTVVLVATGNMTEEVYQFLNGEQVGVDIYNKPFGLNNNGNPIQNYISFYTKYMPDTVLEGW